MLTGLSQAEAYKHGWLQQGRMPWCRFNSRLQELNLLLRGNQDTA